MQDYSRLVDTSMIMGVERVGADVVVSLRYTDPGYKWRGNGTVTFVSVTRIDSEDLTNDLIERELEPGFKVSILEFGDGVAVFCVCELSMHDSYPVRHSISCAAVRVRRRMDVLRTVLNHIF